MVKLLHVGVCIFTRACVHVCACVQHPSQVHGAFLIHHFTSTIQPSMKYTEHAGLCLVAQLCPSLCDPMDCILPGSSVHGILQARILEWVAILFSRGSSQPRD